MKRDDRSDRAAPVPLTHMQRLEAESIHIMREVAAECEKPVMLYSIDKDSACMLHLARKAFFPSPPPFPVLHVDTTWNFRAMYTLRDRMIRESAMELLVYQNPRAAELGINPFTHGSQLHTHMWKTQGLEQALDLHGFDAAFSGARRDEEKSRAKERIFSFRSAQHRWNPKSQRPELWQLYNARKHPGDSIRVFPLSNWTELDIWQYIYVENIPVVPLYLAAMRPVVDRDGTLIMVDDDRMPLRPGELPMQKMVRFRTLGCYPLTGAIESTADTLPAVIQEMLLARTSELQRRLIDHDASDLLSTDIEQYLRQYETKSLLRFITCGSVDDGKSTLIGRLLCQAKSVFDDPLAAGEADSRHWGTQGREIDVAYRFFTTNKRKFIVADTLGHEQYTRNMISAASTADVAVIVIDARKGLLTQTRRHSLLVSLIGIRKVVLAINKMDLVDYAERVFRDIEVTYREFAKGIGLEDITVIPLSALRGDNVLVASDNTTWYHGPTLIAFLDSVELDETCRQKEVFRMPVQGVNRPDLDFRSFSGTISSGMVEPGDAIRAQPSGRESRITRIVTASGDLPRAVAGQSITLTLADDIDISRGDMISAASAPSEVADQFECTVVWMAEEPMLPGRAYLLKIGALSLSATMAEPKYRINVNTLEHLAAKRLDLNEIGVCNVAVDRPVPFDPYASNRDTGGFILIDRMSNQTVGAGMLHFALRRSHNIHVQPVDVNKAARAAQKHQRPAVLWFTGLSGAGKSSIANLVDKKLHARGRHTYLLDGDNVRHGLCRDLGFTAADRIENIRRIAETAKLMVDAGLVVLTAFISPFRAERAMARELFAEGEFVEIHVDTPLEVAEQRDVKGLYAKARRGELANFTGIDSPYEAPEAPELRIDTVASTVDAAADRVIVRMRELGLIK